MISILADSCPEVIATHNTQTFEHLLNLHFDWLRAVVFQLNLKYRHVKITNLLLVVG